MTVDRVLTGGLAVAGAVVGVLLAVVGAFLVPTGPGPFSVGIAIALLNAPFCRAMGRAARSVAVGTVPALTWLTAAMMLAAKRPEGDLVLGLQAKPIAFLLVGTVAGAVGIGTIRTLIARDDAVAD